MTNYNTFLQLYLIFIYEHLCLTKSLAIKHTITFPDKHNNT